MTARYFCLSCMYVCMYVCMWMMNVVNCFNSRRSDSSSDNSYQQSCRRKRKSRWIKKSIIMCSVCHVLCAMFCYWVVIGVFGWLMDMMCILSRRRSCSDSDSSDSRYRSSRTSKRQHSSSSSSLSAAALPKVATTMTTAPENIVEDHVATQVAKEIKRRVDEEGMFNVCCFYSVLYIIEAILF